MAPLLKQVPPMAHASATADHSVWLVDGLHTAQGLEALDWPIV